MEHKTLHDLGFKSRKKNKSRKKARKELPTGPPTNTTMDKIHNEFININRHLPAEAPPSDTGGGTGVHTDNIRKADEGFETWVEKKWLEGYPRVEEG